MTPAHNLRGQKQVKDSPPLDNDALLAKLDKSFLAVYDRLDRLEPLLEILSKLQMSLANAEACNKLNETQIKVLEATIESQEAQIKALEATTASQEQRIQALETKMEALPVGGTQVPFMFWTGQRYAHHTYRRHAYLEAHMA